MSENTENRFSAEELRKHQEEIGELFDADPNCWHVLDPECYSGIKCTKCNGWFCC